MTDLLLSSIIPDCRCRFGGIKYGKFPLGENKTLVQIKPGVEEEEEEMLVLPQWQRLS